MIFHWCDAVYILSRSSMTSVKADDGCTQANLNWYSFCFLHHSHCKDFCTYYCIIMFISFITVVYRSQHYELLLIWKLGAANFET